MFFSFLRLKFQAVYLITYHPFLPQLIITEDDPKCPSDLERFESNSTLNRLSILVRFRPCGLQDFVSKKQVGEKDPRGTWISEQGINSLRFQRCDDIHT